MPRPVSARAAPPLQTPGREWREQIREQDLFAKAHKEQCNALGERRRSGDERNCGRASLCTWPTTAATASATVLPRAQDCERHGQFRCCVLRAYSEAWPRGIGSHET